MEYTLAIFKKDSFTARTITNDNGEIWFVAKDIAQALGYSEGSNTTRLFQSVPKFWAEVKRIHLRSENGVEQARDVLCLSEQGLYFFLGRSDKKAALPYQIWVANEVVPSIRKHGFYATPAAAEKILEDPDTFIKVLEAYKALKNKNAQLTAKIEEDRPKVVFADAVESSKSCILIGLLANILKQNGINIGQNRLFAWLREHGFLCKGFNSKRNTPTQKSIDLGLFEVKERVIANPDGSSLIRPTTMVTGKGQRYFVSKFLSGEFVI